MLSTVSRRRYHAPCLSLALFLGATLLPSGANAQDNDPLNPTMSAHLSNLPLKVALDLLSRSAATTIPFTLPPEIAAKIDPNQTVDVDITNGTFQDALNSMLDQINPPLAFHIENGKYVLESSPTPRPNWGRKPVKKPKKGMQFKTQQTPFEDAVRLLFFHNRAERYRIDPTVTAFLDPVTLSVEDATFDDVLKQLLNAVPGQKPSLTFRREKDFYLITNTSGAGRDNPVRATTRNEAIGLPSYHPTPTIKKAEAADARLSVPLRQLFQQTDANYVLMLPNSVAAMPHVTFTMQNVPLEQAVVHLLRSAPTEPLLILSLMPVADDPYLAQTATASPINAGLGAGKTPAGQSASKLDRLYVVKPNFPPNASPSTGDYRFTFRFQNVSIYDALKTLMHDAAVSYLLDPALRAIHVSAAGDDLTLEKACDKLLSASPKPLDWKTTNGIFMVKAK